MSRTNLMGFDACQHEVEGRMRAREPFGSVENVINGARITEDEKAALWLLAWSMRRRITQRRDSGAMLTRLSPVAD